MLTVLSIDAPVSAHETLRMAKNRIDELRKMRGLSRKQLADHLGISAQAIGRIINGQRKLHQEYQEKLAEILECDVGDLMRAKRTRPQTIPLVGYVGAGAQYWPDPVAGPWVGFDEVDAPDPDGVCALRVRGDSMIPVYRSGDLLFVSKDQRHPASSFIGRDCVVQVKNGPTYVKRLEKGSRANRYRLASYKADPINDVEIDWAAPILWVGRA